MKRPMSKKYIRDLKEELKDARSELKDIRDERRYLLSKYRKWKVYEDKLCGVLFVLGMAVIWRSIWLPMFCKLNY